MFTTKPLVAKSAVVAARKAENPTRRYHSAVAFYTSRGMAYGDAVRKVTAELKEEGKS